jgi:hypothetical protein
MSTAMDGVAEASKLRVGRRLAACAASAAVLIGVSAQPAIANWLKVSRSPSATEPYFACPSEGTRPVCQTIVDPPVSTHARGPVQAGAVTNEPEAEVSPALQGSGVGGGFSPADLRSAYNLPSTSAGSGQTIAIVDAFDDPNAESNLGTYRSEYGIGECTTSNGCFRKVNETGGTSYPAPNEEWASEISLDLDMASAVCPNCHILLVEATTNNETDLGAAENEAVALGATEISNSFAGPSGGYSSPYRTRESRSRLRRATKGTGYMG